MSIREVKGIGPVMANQLNAKGIFSLKDLIAADEKTIATLKIGKYVDRARTLVADPVEKEMQLLIDKHNWFEKKVRLPASEEGGLMDAIVYELSLQPGNRVAFLCSQKQNDHEKICDMTYTPQFLAHFNTHLPILQVKVSPTLIKQNKYRFVLDNTLVETQLIQSFSKLTCPAKKKLSSKKKS